GRSPPLRPAAEDRAPAERPVARLRSTCRQGRIDRRVRRPRARSRAWSEGRTRRVNDDFAALADARYVSLTTFKRDGTAVSTPVWVASDDGRRLLVWSGAKTWKVRRLASDPRVLVARCDFKGRERGPRVEGTARVIDDGELGSRLMRRKYGWQKR